jgi:hypothetical protein
LNIARSTDYSGEAMLTIQEFANDLSSIPEDTHRGVLDYLQQNKVRLANLEPYTCCSPEHCTRNLIHRTPLFELIAICSDSGQKSAIHNHRDQRCWKAIACDRVKVHNFKLVCKNAVTHYYAATHGG